MASEEPTEGPVAEIVAYFETAFQLRFLCLVSSYQL